MMFRTSIDLPEENRVKLISLLNARLADSINLSLQSKQAHWNVKGPSFIALHELFDKVVDVALEATDEIAERITALGGVAVGTVSAVAATSKLAEYPTNLTTGKQHVTQLAAAIATVAKSTRAAIDASTDLGDADTADLFTGISRDLDKYLWFVEAHLQSDE